MDDDTRISRRDSFLKLGGLLAGATAVGGWKVAEDAGAGPAGVASGLVACVLAPEQTEGPYYLDDQKLRRDITDGKARRAAGAAPDRRRRLDLPRDSRRGGGRLALRRRGAYSGVQGDTGTSCAASSARMEGRSRCSARSTRAGTRAARCTST